jgi:hydrogenase maturation factor HypF (carbamoyltransferase family)
VASLLVEHGRDGAAPILAFCFDGTGYGSDGAIWGGEVLVADYEGFERLAHFSYAPLPGGDAAIRRPYRMALAAPDTDVRYRFDLRENGRDGPRELDWRPVVRAIVADVRAGVPVAAISAAFHEAVAVATVDVALAVTGGRGAMPVGLTGGVYQNRRLLVRTRTLLERAGFTVLVHRLVPPNDGGLSLGQAATCGAWLAAGRRT